MSFFDDKQEVLKIELTPYGKNLLANGKLKPVFYSFHDDEILYDIQFSNGSELQHSASSRILDETIYLKPQGRIAPVDYTTRNIKPQDETTDNNLFLTILGNSSLNSDYKPAWNLKLLRGSISGTSNYYTGSTVQFLQWPNLSSNIAPYSESFDQQFVSVQSNGTIYAQGIPYTDGQYNTLIPIGVVVHQNRSTINADGKLTINFTAPTREMLGTVTYNGFPLPESEIGINNHSLSSKTNSTIL